MNTFLKYLGVIILLIGVLFLVLYFCAIQSNVMLVLGLVFEVIGILTYILINKKLD